MNGLVKTLIKPDWDDNPKRSEILNAANILQIGEFQLIQLAYKVWYGKILSEDKINKILKYNNFIFSCEVCFRFFLTKISLGARG